MTLFSEVSPYFDTIEAERGGFKFTARLAFDDSHGAPWDECDSHGPVRTGRGDKRPGELLLGETGCNGGKRFYDFAEACRIARRDRWDAPPYYAPAETPRQRAAKAARADFDRLAAWCRDDWFFCGVIVKCYRHDREVGFASLWGIESDAGAYLIDVANELADQAEAEAEAFIAELIAARVR